jgi:murein DD-endopeptidase MepM/ murein hydrolase activator NlpD
MSPFRPGTRLVLALVAVLIAAALPGGVAHADPLGERRHELQHRLAETKERIGDARARERSLDAAVTETSDEIAQVEGELDRLAGQLGDLERRLSRSRSQLAALESDVARQTARLQLATRQLGVAQNRLNERLVEVYTGGEVGLTAILLGASGLEDALDRLELRARVLEHDSKIVSQVALLRERVTSERVETMALRERREVETAALREQVSAQRAVHARLASRREALASLRDERQRSLASIRVSREEWEAQADALEAESARVAQIIAAASATPPAPPAEAVEEPVTGGSGGAEGSASAPAPAPAPAAQGFVWPVRGPVVSPFGQRWGRLHAGIDIAAPAGTPIVASAAGRVIYSGSMSGYGLIVIIQHAGGIATAYAHNSRNMVSVGQAVSQGQQIAAVGCTGTCFGDHVHFEVRVNGSPVDPMGYL